MTLNEALPLLREIYSLYGSVKSMGSDAFSTEHDEAMRVAIDFIASAAPAVAPPREPTQEMIEAGWIVTGPEPDMPRKHCLSAMWQAMYDAAPQAAPAEPEPRSMDYGNWCPHPGDEAQAAPSGDAELLRDLDDSMRGVVVPDIVGRAKSALAAQAERVRRLTETLLTAHADLIEAVREGNWNRVADAVETMRPAIDAAQGGRDG